MCIEIQPFAAHKSAVFTVIHASDYLFLLDISFWAPIFSASPLTRHLVQGLEDVPENKFKIEPLPILRYLALASRVWLPFNNLNEFEKYEYAKKLAPFTQVWLTSKTSS